MLDEKRIRQMTKLAFFEKKEEKNALRIGRYFRSDYIGKELLKNFFLASIGYILVLAVAVLYHIEWLVDEIDTIDLQFAAGCLIASYLCFLAVYSIAVYVISTIRYQGAQKKLKWYGKELDDLQNIYEEQEKAGRNPGAGGRKHDSIDRTERKIKRVLRLLQRNRTSDCEISARSCCISWY